MVILSSSYRAPHGFSNGHLQSIYPSILRPIPKTMPRSERIATPDGDFLDLDWHQAKSKRSRNLVIVSHGLEGNARKKYPLGMAKHLTALGWDVLCYNFRGCSGDENLLPRFYHSGVTDDLDTVINHGIRSGNYRVVGLVGFSMGGNQTLKYLGEVPAKVPDEVIGAVTFSVPCDLAASSKRLERRENWLYMYYFMRSLRKKIRFKAKKFPNLIDTTGLNSMRTFFPFDDRYTAPLHGFKDAMDYYLRCSSLFFLPHIVVPTLLVQALDDPFLTPSCYPMQAAQDNKWLHLEMPKHGGHAGFISFGAGNTYWSEVRAGAFLEAARDGSIVTS